MSENFQEELLRFHRSLAGQNDINQLLEKILRFALAQFEADSGCLALAERQGLDFRLCLNRAGESLAVPAPEVQQFIRERISPNPPATGSLGKPGLCTPLIAPDGVQGALFLAYSAIIHEERRDELALFAQHAALLLAHARLRQQLVHLGGQPGEIRRLQAQVDHLNQVLVAVEAGASGVVITDTEGKVTSASGRFLEMCGYTLADLRGRTLDLLKSGQTAPEVFADLWATVRSGRTWRGQMSNKRKDGRIYLVEAAITPLTDEQGQISHFVSVQTDITPYKDMEAEVKRLIVSDPLTGLLNKAPFLTVGEQTLRQALRYNEPLCLLLLDLDYLKSINDKNGQQAGDQVIKAMSDLLLEGTRVADILCRYGGEEFAVMMPHTPLADGMMVAERLRTAAGGKAVYTAGGALRFTVSIGVSAPAPDDTLEKLLERAEIALALAKKEGRDKVKQV